MNYLSTDLSVPSEELVEVILYLTLFRADPQRYQGTGELQFVEEEVTRPLHVKVPKNYVGNDEYMDSYIKEKLDESGSDIASVSLVSMESSLTLGDATND